MGILNVTPDSFSDGGLHNSFDEAFKAACEMVEQGASIIDVGGESTRPGGYTPVSADEEMSRVIPVISKISSELDVAISVDTIKSQVADEAMKAGCHIINDINGLLSDENMACVASKHSAGVVVMFNPRLGINDEISDIVKRAEMNLILSVNRALDAGVSSESIMTDPGVGFDTTREDDIELIKNIDKCSLDKKYPILLGASRKRIAAHLIGRESSPMDRDSISTGIALAGVSNGASVIRTHNVQMTVDALNGYWKLLRVE